MDYNPKEIEAKWQAFWQENQTYQVKNDTSKPKYYVLDMFPYPSGAGLHIGHPLGYIATDIFSRYKRMRGFNVLHPMGFDSFGLPAEQYAIDTGQHPAITTAQNIANFKNQLAKIGFNYDWEREVQTSDPKFYKWTQWIFQQIFQSWFNYDTQKAEPIENLIAEFEKNGNTQVNAACDEDTPQFSAEEWNQFSKEKQYALTLKYRLTYLADSYVNWCPALGTVLANDEIKDGLSERGGYPVERKKMRQWMMRITAYADRLLQGLEEIDWSEALKDQQRNWIGKSLGCEIHFDLSPNPSPLERGINASEKGFPFYYTTTAEKWKKLIEFAKKNRKNSTEAEKTFWEAVRRKNLGFKFRRQHPIDDFIADFVCIEKKLIVEIDGEIHQTIENKDYDELRTELLNQKGFRVIRFYNDEVLNSLDDVISKVKNALNENVEVESNTPSFEESGENIKNFPSFEGGWGEVLIAFTTRIDTIFGVTYLALAPEHEIIPHLTTPEQKDEVEKYVNWAKNRSERERQAEVKTVSGVFTGSYAINPFNQEKIPIWVADYVLAGYGTGVVMGVPSSDDRDFRFAKHFNLPIVCVIEGTETMENPTEKKYGKMINSDFLNGLDTKEAIEKAIEFVESKNIGKKKINFRLRDAVFSRQRYWGEPVPVYFSPPAPEGGKYKGEREKSSPFGGWEALPFLVDEQDLPLVLPEISEYKPTEEGEPPLARAKDWFYPTPTLPKGEGVTLPSGADGLLETTTMPGWAGSSWYFLRYADAKNENEFASKEATDYWNQVDLYVGGTEHAVGHLLYSRFWTNFLYDRGFISFKEPFKKLINQGMIQGESALIYRVKNTEEGKEVFVSAEQKDKFETSELHVTVNALESGNVINIEELKKWRPEDYANAEFILAEDGKFYCHTRVEKLSKRFYNAVNPDDVIAQFSADTLRLYEMFLGPLEQSKPWNTNGIDGTFKFLKKLCRLFDKVEDAEPTKAELKTLHKTIKGVTEDLDRYSFNTPVSKFMVCVNELQDLKCHKKVILEPLIRLLAPYAPHITEELWHQLGNESSIHHAEFPIFNPEYLKEDDFEYPIQINGKLRLNLSFPLDMPQDEMRKAILENETVQKWTEGKEIKKFIIVPKKIINVVV